MAEEKFQAQALERQLKQSKQTGPSATHCDECGDEIPEGRRKAIPGCRLCIPCKQETEGGRK
jgi:phage/conjugal plasmid C-4 type zinc finger TraR family protein